MMDAADAAPPVVRAQSFELVNATGETRAVLGTLDDVPLLGFVDASGVHRAALLLDTDGSPGIFLRDQDAQVRASLYLNDGSPTLGLQQAEDGGHVEACIDAAGARIVLQDRNDTIRAALTMGATGQPALLLQDAGGAIRLRAGLDDDDGTPTLSLQDTGSDPRAVLSLRPDGTPVLHLHDEFGQLRLSVDVNADGTPALVLRDDEGKASLVIAGLAASPAVSVHDPSGTLRATMGVVDGIPAILTINAEGDRSTTVDAVMERGRNNPSTQAQGEAVTRLIAALQDFVASLRPS